MGSSVLYGSLAETSGFKPRVQDLGFTALGFRDFGPKVSDVKFWNVTSGTLSPKPLNPKP